MTRDKIDDSLERLDAALTTQAGRMDLLQRWLDDHGTRIDALTARFDAARARIEALLAPTTHAA